MTALKFDLKGALAFINRAGIALEGAKGPYPNMVEALLGESIKGNWWSHPRANYVYNLLLRVKESPEILVTRLYKRKITFIHRRLWSYLPAVVAHISPEAAVVVEERHLPSGRHEVVERPITRVLSERGVASDGAPSEKLAQLFEPITSSVKRPRSRSRSR